MITDLCPVCGAPTYDDYENETIRCGGTAHDPPCGWDAAHDDEWFTAGQEQPYPGALERTDP